METTIRRREKRMAYAWQEILTDLQFWPRVAGKLKPQGESRRTYPHLSNHLRRDVGLPPAPPRFVSPAWAGLL